MSQIGFNIKYIKSMDIGKPLKKPKVKIPPSNNFLDDVIALKKKIKLTLTYIFS